ncbi:MAG: type II toxin-antitoxin system RelE/ParE family toxin [Candidatus Planktophila sp.]|nr:type II toxin-antitoxin system RelE/ParE family toxin [Candidatus Planktophila sp.]
MSQLLYTPKFLKQLKKLNQNQKLHLDKAILQVASDPFIGTSKAHELSGIYIYKFRLINQEVLLAYRVVSPDLVRLIKVGPHENFYRDLKREN